MSAEEMRFLFLRIWNGVWHDKEAPSVIEESFTDDFAMHISSLPEPIAKAGWIEFVGRWQTAFPDGRMDIEDLAIIDNKVWCYWISTGTHSAEYLGVPATGRKVNYKGIDIYRFVNDKIAECRAVPDALSLLRQIGAIPG